MTDNVAEFSTTEQLTACYGDNMAEIKIVDSDGLVIGSANFIINVEKSPTCGGLVSESEIDNLTQQIEDITQQVIGDDYYNKTQTDALLANKANVSDLPDMTDYYTKAQTDNLLNDKADRSDLATLASKAEVTQAISDEDTALKNWVSSNFATPGYVATHYYSKLQVDDLLFNMLPIGSASGNPCIFDTEISGELQALTAEIVASGGGGTPSTPIPIVGHTELNLTRCGKNLFDKTTTIDDNWMNSSGSAVYFAGGFYSALIPVKPNTAYYLSNVIGGTDFVSSVHFDNDMNVIGAKNVSGSSIQSGSITTFNNSAYMRINSNTVNKDTVMVAEGLTPSAYEPYNGQTFTVAFGQTVYGGVLDVTRGKLRITFGIVDLGDLTYIYSADFHEFFAPLSDCKFTGSGSFTGVDCLCSCYQAVTTRWDLFTNGMISCGSDTMGANVPYVNICDYAYTDVNTFKSARAGQKLVYELATPIVIDVTAISVFAENGTNNITSDCVGDVNVSYKDTIQHYIDSRI